MLDVHVTIGIARLCNYRTSAVVTCKVGVCSSPNDSWSLVHVVTNFHIIDEPHVDC